MGTQKRILLKLTGEVFLDPDTCSISTAVIKQVIKQIKQLKETHQFSIVTGGGNFFRGNQQGKQLGLTPTTSHQIGMLATMMNGLMLEDLFEQEEVPCQMLTATFCANIGTPANQKSINTFLKEGQTLIFAGGTGNPFFTTDTNAVLRALQIGATEIWKGTNVAGVFSQDPRKNPSAQLIKDLTYQEALDQKLEVMDATAFALASLHQLQIRVFSIFDDNALLHVAENSKIGSIIHI